MYVYQLYFWLMLPLALLPGGRLRGAALDMPQRIYVYGSEAVYDFRLNHTLAVVKAAMDVNADRLGVIEVRSTAESDLWMNRMRAMASVQKGQDDVHVISSFASPDLDEKLRPVRRSIAASVLGERVFLIHPKRREEFEAITSIHALKKYTIGVGQGWIDGEIMQQAGLRIQRSVRYDLLFTMLQGQRFDLLTRSVHEAWDELRLRGFRELDWIGSWTLSYPAPLYLYVNRQQKALATRLEKGLQVLEAQGTLDRLFVEHFGPSILRAGWIHRKRLTIQNPYLPAEPPLGFSSWKQWHKKADADLFRLYKLAVQRYRPDWAGFYRPQVLIEQFLKFTGNRLTKFKSPPLVVRAADRPNDTHILAAIFALELALSQPINLGSPFYQKSAQYLIDKTLDQKSALESLDSFDPFIDAVATQTNLQRQRRFATATVDVAQGLIGRRVFVVLKKNLQIFRDVRAVEDLRSFRICVGTDWPDRQVLELIGIPTVTRRLIAELYDELRQGSCDGITRAVYEARDELLARPLDDFAMDPYLLLSYPAAQHIFFASHQTDLASATTRGLRIMQEQGILREIMEVVYGDSIRYARVQSRRVLRLSNPSGSAYMGLDAGTWETMLWGR